MLTERDQAKKNSLLQYRLSSGGKLTNQLRQRGFIEAALGGLGRELWSGEVVRYRERSISVLFVVYCEAVWYCGTESGLLVACL